MLSTLLAQLFEEGIVSGGGTTLSIYPPGLDLIQQEEGDIQTGIINSSTRYYSAPSDR